MYKRTYLIADTIVSIDTLYKTFHALAKDYVYQGDKPAELDICITGADIEEQRVEFARTQELEGHPGAVTTDGYLEFTAVHKALSDYLVGKGYLLMHGSVIEVDGQAYLFTAKSGTGKSTHTRLWREHFGERAHMVNDDKPFLKVIDGQTFAYGSPWNGKEHLGDNTCAPLKAICILERDSSNHIEEISPAEALPMLVQQTYRSDDLTGATASLDILAGVMSSVRFYRLGCNMSPQAAVVSYSGMNP